VSARPPAEILRQLQAVMAELTAALQEPDPKSDISPKLRQALNNDYYASALGRPKRETRASMPSTADVPLESHEDIRAKARAYKAVELDSSGDLREQARAVARGYKPADYKYESEKPERLKDYTPSDDPDWPPDSVWLGTGDHKLIE
jgi:hypothetical protein